MRKYTKYQPPPCDVVPVKMEPGQNDRDEVPVPAQVVQEPVVGHIPDDEGVQQDDVAVGQPADGIVIDGPKPAGVQVQPEASSVRIPSRATQGMTWAQVVQVQPEAGQVRRSTRETKGLTSRYKDFVLGDEPQD